MQRVRVWNALSLLRFMLQIADSALDRRQLILQNLQLLLQVCLHAAQHVRQPGLVCRAHIMCCLSQTNRPTHAK